MRFRLTLEVDREAYGNMIPLSYQYELSAWIYSVIARSNSIYSLWLHDNGFSDKNKKFKMFTFSNLQVPEFKRIDDRLCILSNRITLYLSFLPEKSTEEFIKGIFSETESNLGDSKSKIRFRVQSLELLPPPVFDNTEFETLSPIVVALKKPNGSVEYVSPESENYGLLLFNNLKEKYKAFYGNVIETESFDFKLLSAAYSKLIKIKANTSFETKVKGFNFAFKMNTDERLLKIMYETGAGEKGSLGFGMVFHHIE
jgi:CRISPR-associated endoribonuclease Cas6